MVRNPTPKGYRDNWEPDPLSWHQILSLKLRANKIKIIISVLLLIISSIINFNCNLNNIEAKNKIIFEDLNNKKILSSLASTLDYKVNHQISNIYKWQNINTEINYCKPSFFKSKELVAHHLYKVLCLNKDGSEFVLFKKTSFVFWEK